MARRQDIYDKTGVPVVWWIDIEEQSAIVCRLGRKPEVIASDGEVFGEGVLNGLRIRLSTIFDDR